MTSFLHQYLALEEGPYEHFCFLIFPSNQQLAIVLRPLERHDWESERAAKRADPLLYTLSNDSPQELSLRTYVYCPTTLLGHQGGPPPLVPLNA